MQAVWEDQYRINSYDCGFNKEAKLHSLLNHFQESAQNHATHLGFGFEDLESAGQLWVLSRLHMVIHSLPHWGDFIMVTTWPKIPESPFAFRDFEIRGLNNSILLSGTTSWLILDYHTRRPTRDIQTLRDAIDYPIGKHAIKEPAPRLPALKDRELVSSLTAGFSDIDPNGHVNHAIYLAWITDLLPASYHQQYMAGEVSLNFLAEVKMGDTIDIFANHSEQEWNFEATRKQDGTVAFRARFLSGKR